MSFSTERGTEAGAGPTQPSQIATRISSGPFEFPRECLERDPGTALYYWNTIESLLHAGTVEKSVKRIDEAFRYFDEASSMVVESANTSPQRHRYATLLSQEYSLLLAELSREDKPEYWKHARDGQLKMLALFEAEPSDRPDWVLCKACVLADNGKWERARGLVHALSSRGRSIHEESMPLQEFVELGLMDWSAREKRHLEGANKAQQSETEPMDRAATKDEVSQLSEQAAAHRRAGRLADAERTVGILMAIAKRLERQFPGDFNSHVLLSQAYIQESKNAWRRLDVEGIKKGLTQSMEELRQALLLAPDDVEARLLLDDREERLANLPSSLTTAKSPPSP